MVSIFSEYRMVKNEVVFRRHNEQIQKNIDTTKELAVEDGQTAFVDDHNLLLHFYCECADEDCRKRIVMSLNEYKKIHKKRDQFIIIPGHEVVSIERIVVKKADYFVVQKLLDPPETATKLQPTDIDNS